MERRCGKSRPWLPASLEGRAIVLVVLLVVSIGLPAFFAFRILSRHQDRRHAAAAEALLAVALSAYLQDAADGSTVYDEWLTRLSKQELRVRWAGVFNQDRTGLEFRRRTDLPLAQLLDQIQFDARGPQSAPLRLAAGQSQRFTLLTVPQPDGRVLAAVVDLDTAGPSSAPLFVAGLICLAVLGLAAAFAWFQCTVQRPITQLVERRGTLLEGWAEAVHDDTPEELRVLGQALHQALTDVRQWQGEAHDLRRSLNERVDAQTRQISRDLRQAEQSAGTDLLTGLANRRTLERELPALFEQQQRDGRELVAAVLDLDNFKHLNDTLGHHAGDELLAFLGELIRGTVRKSTDLAARLGGDEFLILLPDTSMDEASDVIRRIRNLFLQRARLLDQVEPRPGLSVGIAGRHAHNAVSWQQLLKLADAAMYEAKQTRAGVARPSGQTTARRGGRRAGDTARAD
jgi:diguanylate cyclase (GGDEF)-like protein